MTLANVQASWPVYQGLVQVLFGALNGKIDLDHASPVRPFQKDAPADWGDWVDAALNHIDARTELAITDAAFKKVAEMLTASEIVAAKVVVAEPTADAVDKVQQSLAEVNKAVKADGRFHAALDIGVALSGEIKKGLQA